jgi:hypothetical protein
MASRSREQLQELFRANTVVQLGEIQTALDDASRATAFRYLKQVPYRSSYNHNGRYYTRHDPAQYDRFGLFSHQGILFSRDGSLSATVVRAVQEAEAGLTQRELRERLRVRVQVVLAETMRRGMIDRERVERWFVYTHADPNIREAQLQNRRASIVAAVAEISDVVIIQILLTLLRHPGSDAADVMRHLHGHSPPIAMEQVRAVFDRYDLDNLGEKGGSWNC